MTPSRVPANQSIIGTGAQAPGAAAPGAGHASPYATPDNVVELLSAVVEAASRARLYAPRLGGRRGVGSLEEFRALPTTPYETFRRAPTSATLAAPGVVDWVVGAIAGQRPEFAAIAESVDEGGVRADTLADAVKSAIPLGASTVCAAVASPARRYFAAEAAAILISAGANAHVFTDANPQFAREALALLRPHVVLLLADRIAEADLPASTRLAVTFNRVPRLTKTPQLDVFHLDALGFLGHSTDLERYVYNCDTHYFERSEAGALIVTPLYQRVQPALRIVVSGQWSVVSG